MQYLEVAEARHLKGLRLVLTRGVPNPWGETAKGFFRVKNIPFVAVSQYPGEPNLELRDWTGQTSGPAAVYNDEPPKLSWGPVLHLAERLSPAPSLLPATEPDRIRMLGLCEEISGEDGLAWHRRRHSMLAWSAPKQEEEYKGPMSNDGATRIMNKYGYSDAEDVAENSVARMVAIVTAMAEVAAEADRAGSRYFIGGRLCALDVMWAGFCGLFVPPPEHICPMPPEVRALYTVGEKRVRDAFTQSLLDRRDYMYTHHMEPPTNL